MVIDWSLNGKVPALVLTVDIELDLLLDGFTVAVEAVVRGADVDAAVVAGRRRVRDGEAAYALRAVRHLATLLKQFISGSMMDKTVLVVL